jgi:acyl dehydratase
MTNTDTPLQDAGDIHETGGPYFEELRIGELFDAAPGLTLTEGYSALHAAIVGDRMRLPLDRPLSTVVTGAPSVVAHPGLVCDVAIGQSTLATQRVIANLFYRGLVLRRAPVIGDTLRTTTEVVALRENRRRPDRLPTGLAVLRIRTSDQEGRRVLDFWRCAMLPLRDLALTSGHHDDLGAISSELDRDALRGAAAGWRLDKFRAAVPGEHAADLRAGSRWRIEGGDVVSAAPELARLTLNIAMAHHDPAAAGGRRLVYGGHTIGIAGAQLCRALPNLVMVVAWHGCDHLSPVFEGDVLRSEISLGALDPLESGGALLHLRSRVTADRDDERVEVLDWRPVALMA